ncbi:MAG: DUF4440 domain-containing protein, partial [Myxococcota bacterium]
MRRTSFGLLGAALVCLACSDPAPAANVAVAEGRPPASLAPGGSPAPAQVEVPSGARATAAP